MKKEPDEVELITSLNFNPRNPRTITPLQLEALRRSLKEFGDLGGIVKNNRTGRLVGGHQRIAAFAQAEVPATIDLRLSEPDRTGTVAYGHIDLHDTRFSYREVEWDEAREAAANIAANKLGGEFDDGMLAELLSELKETEDVSLTGFTDEEIAALIANSQPPDPPSEFPESNENIATEHRCPKCGYVWSGKTS